MTVLTITLTILAIGLSVYLFKNPKFENQERKNIMTTNAMPVANTYYSAPIQEKKKKEGKKLLATFLGGFWTLCIVATIFVSLSPEVSPVLILAPCFLTLFALIIVGAFFLLTMLILKKSPAKE